MAIIDMEGRAANRNPAKADEGGYYWGGMSGRYYACQGNTLTGREVIVATAKAYEETKGSLADRLMAPWSPATAPAGTTAAASPPASASRRRASRATGSSCRWTRVPTQSLISPGSMPSRNTMPRVTGAAASCRSSTPAPTSRLPRRRLSNEQSLSEFFEVFHAPSVVDVPRRGLLASVRNAADKPDLKTNLARPINSPNLALEEWQRYTEARVPRVPQVKTAAEWDEAGRADRADVLDKVVFRGEAAAWRDAKTQGRVAGHDRRRTRLPDQEAALRGPARPVDPRPALRAGEARRARCRSSSTSTATTRNGKAADYKQIRCINLAKRGMLALNVEWLGMGQLRGAGYRPRLHEPARPVRHRAASPRSTCA